MKKSSFTFDGHNSLEEWGIFCTHHDTIMPPKRQRRQAIPGRDGSYDYGAQNYDDRLVRLTCELVEPTTRAGFREIAYRLSHKGKLVLWDEPDKHYIGELYDAAELENIAGGLIRKFELNFTCEPFAYHETVSRPLISGVNPVEYRGTARAPCVIRIDNPNSYAVSNITITATKRRM